jgi:Ca2+-transporting ATPase
MPPRKTPSKKRGAGDGPYTPWTASAPDVCAKLDVDPQTGLSETKVESLRSTFGFNELDKEDGKPLWKLVLEQFDDALVKILLLAAVVSFALAFTEERAPGVDVSLVDFVEPGVILLILVLNAIVGVWQESNAENALEALKEMQSETARCLRDGAWRHDLPARELVPGDVVEIRTGDRVPAGRARLWSCAPPPCV